MTGQSEPEAAGSWVLARPASTTSWAIVKLGSEGAVLCARGAAGPIHIDGLKVRVFRCLLLCNAGPLGLSCNHMC